ncbi:hypothetical protein UF75_3395 [Desulfosporosinus sp. I2]|uniref:hypothetical protein n=1 Tax=Desulfosporosinus sp. I2 TaxID=1617025 RepID=UPI00061EAD22|nr:hypothetical protein [Desulfosporosinus sp. I2]KJR46246.1 hypothetical protein UF75_3395 [Desulfosporosinus sp. I2]
MRNSQLFHEFIVSESYTKDMEKQQQRIKGSKVVKRRFKKRNITKKIYLPINPSMLLTLDFVLAVEQTFNDWLQHFFQWRQHP